MCILLLVTQTLVAQMVEHLTCKQVVWVWSPSLWHVVNVLFLQQCDEEDDEDEDDGDDEEDESDTNDDEIASDMIDDRDSPDDVSKIIDISF